MQLDAEEKARQERWHAETRARFAQMAQDPTRAPGPPRERQERVTWESRAWSDTREFLQLMTQLGGDALSDDALAQLAAEIFGDAADMDGPMPPDILALVQRYSPR